MSKVKLHNRILKLTIVLVIGVFWLLYRSIYLKEDEGIKEYQYCFKDVVLIDYVNDITAYLSQNLQHRDYLLIFGSNLLDMVLPVYMIYFIFKGVSWQTIFNMALFYNLRGPLIQNLSGFEYYDTYLFDNPGFFSFSVPYYRASDFFFSGHAGCAILCAFQFKKWGHNSIYVFGIVVGFLEGFIMVLLRTHYFIDIVFGLIAGHYFFILAEIFAIPFDYYLPLSIKQRQINLLHKSKTC